MSARDEIVDWLWRLGDEQAAYEADRILARHAHELAEKIRSELPKRTKNLGGIGWTLTTTSSAQAAADLIDPEVSDE